MSLSLALPGERGFSEPSRWVRAFGEDVPSYMPAGDWEDVHLRTVADASGTYWDKRNDGSPVPYVNSFSLADVNGDNMVDIVTFPLDGGVYVSLSTGIPDLVHCLSHQIKKIRDLRHL